MAGQQISTVSLPEKISLRCFSIMNEFRQQGTYCDVNVMVGGSTFPCHRLVLASCSTFFNAMFSNQCSERVAKNILLQNVSAKCFENVLEFFYTKQLNIDSFNSSELFEAAFYFGIGDLEYACDEYFEREMNFSEEHLVEMCRCAKLNDKIPLYEKIVEYIAKNWSHVSRLDSFLEISYEVLEDVFQQKFSIEEIDHVMAFINLWKKNKNIDVEMEKKLLRFLPKKPACSDTTCLYVREKSTELKYDWRWKNSTWEEKQLHPIKPYYKCELNVVCNGHLFTYFWDGEGYKQEFRVKRRYCDYYKTLADFPLSCYSSTSYNATTVNDTIYFYKRWKSMQYTTYELINGLKNVEKSNNFFAYVYDADKWFYVPKPIDDPSSSCITSLNDRLYLIGDTFQGYDHRSPNWIMLPKMSHSHQLGAACSYNEKIYVLSRGNSSSKTLNGHYLFLLEEYDLKAGRWQVREPCLSKYHLRNYSLRFINYHGMLWAFAQHEQDFPEYYKYNPISNSWIVESWEKEGYYVKDAFVL